MALPSSGQISFSDIRTELSLSGTVFMAGSSIPVGSSLFGTASSAVNKTAPHKISEFYGYTHVSWWWWWWCVLLPVVVVVVD